jgi:hypothetical protein
MIPDLEELARLHDRPLSTLQVLDDDPYRLSPARVRNAEWFADMWQQYGRPGLHVHGLHYLLALQAQPPRLPIAIKHSASEITDEYLNSEAADRFLRVASRDARYLQLVSSDDVVDRRNSDPDLPVPVVPVNPQIGIAGGLRLHEPIGFSLPHLVIDPPTIPQRFRAEIWIEKSTMEKFLLPLKTLYGVGLVTLQGESSLTRCLEFVTRSEADGRPVRILYVSDHDPAGTGMPIATARKIQFLLDQKDSVLDVQLRPIVLTQQQCIDYELPRRPFKVTESRGGRFEQRFGAGATELDALEAKHPGELQRILTTEILRYFDGDLDDNVAAVAEEAQERLDEINNRVAHPFRKEVAALAKEEKALRAAVDAFNKKGQRLEAKIGRALSTKSADIEAGDLDWPEPDLGDDDPDPLFDSTRDFTDQTDCFKLAQDKDIERPDR